MFKFSDLAGERTYSCYNEVGASIENVPDVSWVCPVAGRIAIGQTAHCTLADTCSLGQGVPITPETMTLANLPVATWDRA